MAAPTPLPMGYGASSAAMRPRPPGTDAPPALRSSGASGGVHGSHIIAITSQFSGSRRSLDAGPLRTNGRSERRENVHGAACALYSAGLGCAPREVLGET